MKADRASRTAHFVALGRAMADAGISHVPDFHDPTARFFLSEKGKHSFSRIELAAREGKPSVRLEAARVMADMIALRTVAIDAAVRDAIAVGATQLVILGAGYDGRAWRMPELTGEGVVMYLTRDAMRATLGGIGGRSAPGSTLIVNYHTAHRRLLARLLFRLIGEPQISTWTREEMAKDLGAVGFAVREDSGMIDWNDRFAHGDAKVERGAYMRVGIART